MINASIVIYKHSVGEIINLLENLSKSSGIEKIFVIDNSPEMTPGFDDGPCIYIFNGENKGFGAGHNIALRKTIEEGVPYHIVVNPDISMDVDVPKKLMIFAEQHPDVGHIMPKILNSDGSIQYLCKLLPSPFDLIIRRFLPAFITINKMKKYEMRECGYNKIMEVPYLSGCFMFLRTEALQKSGLFDERFFMYPEDIDLTRRIHRFHKTIFYPEVSVIHEHTRSSYKNVRMFFIHLINLIRYFNKWGWINDAERKSINKRITQSLNL